MATTSPSLSSTLKPFRSVWLSFSALLLLCNALQVSSSLQVLLPLYTSPDASWLQLASVCSSPANKGVTFNLILRNGIGPGTSANALYVNAIKKLKASPNVKILGYVATGNGVTATSATVLAQIKTWISFYGAANLDGFFLDEFLPYKVAPDASINTILASYATIYKGIKALKSTYLVVGGVPYVDARFQKTTIKVADVIAVYQAARSYLAYPTDPAQGSLVNVPAGYVKALMVNKVVLPVAEANAMLTQMVALAKKWGVQYFGASRDFAVYPADIFQFEVNLCK